MKTATQIIPVSAIEESPDNVRTNYDPVQLKQLSDSIVLHGQLQPIGVRPKVVDGKPVAGKFVAIWGHRRLRAHKLASLKEIRCEVRPTTDAEVPVLQDVENNQRVNLHALERSVGHLAMKAAGSTLEEIAKATSTSEATVRDSLKIGDLVAAAMNAFREGKIEFSKAIILAKVPATLQPEVLKWLLTPDRNGELPSSRDLRDQVETNYMLDLKKAPFDTKDALLVKAAGSCTGCLKRTGSQPDFFANVKPDICTDKLCYRGKCDAVLVQKKEAGAKVLSQADAKKAFDQYSRGGEDRVDYNGDFVLADDKRYDSKKTYAQLVDKEQIVIAQNPTTGNVVQLVPKSALPKERQSNGNAAYEASQRKFAAKRKFENEVNKRVEVLVREALTKKLTVAISEKAWRKLADDVAADHWNAAELALARGWGQGWKKNELQKLSLGAVQLFIIECWSQTDSLARALEIDSTGFEKKEAAALKEEQAAKGKTKKPAAKKGKAA